MGQDVHMIAGHSLEGPMKEFPDHVRDRFDKVYHDPILEEYLRKLIRKEFFEPWSDHPWTFDAMGLSSLDDAMATDHCISFSGPWGLSIRIGARSFDLSCPLRLQTFLENDDLADRLVRVFHFIVSKLGGEEFIVVPDNATVSSGFQDRVTEGASMNDIIDGLRSSFGEHLSRTQMRDAINQSSDFDGYMVFRTSF
jgi:hypothetical protein